MRQQDEAQFIELESGLIFQVQAITSFEANDRGALVAVGGRSFAIGFPDAVTLRDYLRARSRRIEFAQVLDAEDGMVLVSADR